MCIVWLARHDQFLTAPFHENYVLFSESRYPSLCERCGPGAGCERYTINMGLAVAGVSNDNRHIQALECLRTNVNASSAVAYAAWQHVREFFTVSIFSIFITSFNCLVGLVVL